MPKEALHTFDNPEAVLLVFAAVTHQKSIRKMPGRIGILPYVGLLSKSPEEIADRYPHFYKRPAGFFFASHSADETCGTWHLVVFQQMVSLCALCSLWFDRSIVDQKLHPQRVMIRDAERELVLGQVA